MRCPKCHYLSFDPEPRCRNCGYDLEVADAELALRTAEPSGEPLPDLTLRERPPAPEALAPRLTLVEDRTAEAEAEAEAEAGVPNEAVIAVAPTVVVEPPPEPRRAPFRAPNTTAELPLFVKDLAEYADLPDERSRGPVAPLVLPPSRPPLAVRRAAPEPARARAKAGDRRLGPLDNDLLEDLRRVEREEVALARDEALAAVTAVDEPGERVDPLRRVGAAALDVVVLGSIAAFVFWATLRLCAASLVDLRTDALVPLIAFIVVMDVIYLLMFTAAGGQTVGKMLMGIRVVDDGTEEGDAVPVRRAAWRAALTVISVVGFGLGWLPALFGRGITLHDRLAHTRVVRA